MPKSWRPVVSAATRSSGREVVIGEQMARGDVDPGATTDDRVTRRWRDAGPGAEGNHVLHVDNVATGDRAPAVQALARYGGDRELARVRHLLARAAGGFDDADLGHQVGQLARKQRRRVIGA